MSDDTTKYISEPQQRILALIRTLSGHEIEGLSPGDIAKLNVCSPSQVTRDLANLKHFGWAEQIQATGRWRLGPEIVRVAARHMTALDRADRQLAQVRSRFGSAEVAGVDPSPRLTPEQAGQFLTDLLAPGSSTRKNQS